MKASALYLDLKELKDNHQYFLLMKPAAPGSSLDTKASVLYLDRKELKDNHQYLLMMKPADDEACFTYFFHILRPVLFILSLLLYYYYIVRLVLFILLLLL